MTPTELQAIGIADGVLGAADDAPRSDDLDACLERAAAGHRRLCPRQVLAVRMGRWAGSLLGLSLPRMDRRLVTFMETDGCAADGVTAATGCTVGRRTLRVLDFGKVAATFVDAETGRAVRIWPHPAARARALALQPDTPDPWRAMLEGYRSLPIEALLRWRPVALKLPLETIMSRPGLHVPCERCGEEVMNGREMLVSGTTLCQACAGSQYWVTTH
jgi:formylmethanofuran dehydrogenase subunit E